MRRTPKRSTLDRVRDALDAMRMAQQFIDGMDYPSYARDKRTIFAVVRALEIVGEATKHVPVAVRSRFADVPWSNMAGMRDVLAHDYFGIDVQVVWQTVTIRIPRALPALERALVTLEKEAKET